MKGWKVIIFKHRFLLFIVCFYLVSHLLNLTLLPIFNDESIYLDWGWVQTHTPGQLYASVYDAKQPLMIWLFGIFANFFEDPLFAGRFVSVLFGLGTTIGIYILTQKLFSKPTALLAALIYSFTPIFVFYDRQALLESGVMCIGIWSCIGLLQMIRENTTKNSVFLGILLGVGYFIKSSMLLFAVAAIAVIVYEVFMHKRQDLVKSTLIAASGFVGVTILLLINPVFWQTLATNSRYSFTLAELFGFPITTWTVSIKGFFEISFFFMTPLLFILGLIGVWHISRKNQKEQQIFIFFFVGALVLQIFLVKMQSQRYIVSVLPFLVICAAYMLAILWNGNAVKRSIVVISLLIPLCVTVLQIHDPVRYIKQFSQYSKYSETAYIHGQTSGFSVKEMLAYLNAQTNPSQPTMIFFGFNVGNPESAVSAYTQKTKNLIGLHIDAKLFENLNQIDCFTSDYPAFLVTRDTQMMGMEKYFVLDKAFVHPDGNYAVGVYKLKSECNGKTASLSSYYQKAIDTSLLLR